MLAITHLNRRGTVFLRYKVGDVGALNHEPCPTLRSDVGAVVVENRSHGRHSQNPGCALVNLGNLKEEFDRMAGIDEYQIVVTSEEPSDPFSMDELIIRLAPTVGTGLDMTQRVIDDVKRLTNFAAEGRTR